MVATTRSGRHIKKPDLYQPIESVLEDDYDADDYDSDVLLDTDIDTEDECEDDSENEDEDVGEDEDVDENGNLKGFVVDDESESEEEHA